MRWWNFLADSSQWRPDVRSSVCLDRREHAELHQWFSAEYRRGQKKVSCKIFDPYWVTPEDLKWTMNSFHWNFVVFLCLMIPSNSPRTRKVQCNQLLDDLDQRSLIGWIFLHEFVDHPNWHVNCVNQCQIKVKAFYKILQCNDDHLSGLTLFHSVTLVWNKIQSRNQNFSEFSISFRMTINEPRNAAQ